MHIAHQTSSASASSPSQNTPAGTAQLYFADSCGSSRLIENMDACLRGSIYRAEWGKTPMSGKTPTPFIWRMVWFAHCTSNIIRAVPKHSCGYKASCGSRLIENMDACLRGSIYRAEWGKTPMSGKTPTPFIWRMVWFIVFWFMIAVSRTWLSSEEFFVLSVWCFRLFSFYNFLHDGYMMNIKYT